MKNKLRSSSYRNVRTYELSSETLSKLRGLKWTTAEYDSQAERLTRGPVMRRVLMQQMVASAPGSLMDSGHHFKSGPTKDEGGLRSLKLSYLDPFRVKMCWKWSTEPGAPLLCSETGRKMQNSCRPASFCSTVLQQIHPRTLCMIRRWKMMNNELPPHHHHHQIEIPVKVGGLVSNATRLLEPDFRDCCFRGSLTESIRGQGHY